MRRAGLSLREVGRLQFSYDSELPTFAAESGHTHARVNACGHGFFPPFFEPIQACRSGGIILNHPIIWIDLILVLQINTP